jgi:hypothetical protein
MEGAAAMLLYWTWLVLRLGFAFARAAVPFARAGRCVLRADRHFKEKRAAAEGERLDRLRNPGRWRGQ